VADSLRVGRRNGLEASGRGWSGEQLYEACDLAVTTDFRDVFAEVAQRHLGAGGLERVFPGHRVDAAKFRGVLG
jgi:uncharacterized protein (DUF1501 family)